MPEKPRRKVYRSAADWRALSAQYERSGLTQAAFCTREGIALHSFKKHYRRHKPGEAALGQFVAVPSPASPNRAGAGELTLPNGVRLAVRGAGRVE